MKAADILRHNEPRALITLLHHRGENSHSLLYPRLGGHVYRHTDDLVLRRRNSQVVRDANGNFFSGPGTKYKKGRFHLELQHQTSGDIGSIRHISSPRQDRDKSKGDMVYLLRASDKLASEYLGRLEGWRQWRGDDHYQNQFQDDLEILSAPSAYSTGETARWPGMALLLYFIGSSFSLTTEVETDKEMRREVGRIGSYAEKILLQFKDPTATVPLRKFKDASNLLHHHFTRTKFEGMCVLMFKRGGRVQPAKDDVYPIQILWNLATDMSQLPTGVAVPAKDELHSDFV
ncbi:hypothetical protein K458DRAFT_456717 [Lentithecium fluviatile CBS 122367]|uniref:Uncharacterized protein n=1 Tax=Lentithecium fluviatile CBS 122367 TaxID=1168545 RepID=A0A6G1IU26_9PLEO|nr:hypothetical protein K458DRAFT_456717 [Lentithecium fluviatile CBS 122367]